MDLGALSRAAAPAIPAVDTFTATVVRADESGLWVVPLGEDTRVPVGPCRGGYTAQGTLAPVGSLVVLILVDNDRPWAVGLDNPALAVSDASLAPFKNPSFEDYTSSPDPDVALYPAGWSDFWTQGRRHFGPDPVPAGKYRRQVVEGVAAHGLRSLRLDVNGDGSLSATNESGPWDVPPGSSLEVSVYSRSDPGPYPPRLVARIFSNLPGEYPGPFASGQVNVNVIDVEPAEDYLRYRGIVTIPAAHARVNLFLDVYPTGGPGSIHLDNVDVDLVQVNPSAAHIDFVRRATATLGGGGIRTVTAGGNVSWTQPFTIAAAGREDDEAPDGRFEISLPPNGTVVPVHHSTARTSYTVVGGVIALSPDEALWYELPVGAAAASQPSRFHILGSSNADGYVVPPEWVLVVRRTAWSSTQHAPEYVWGDGRAQDPQRTPSLNAGWIEGTVVPRFEKTGDGFVVMTGRVRSGAGSAFTLPPGYWPGPGGHRDIVPDGLGAAALLTVSASGIVTTSGNNTDHSIETAFPARQ